MRGESEPACTAEKVGRDVGYREKRHGQVGAVDIVAVGGIFSVVLHMCLACVCMSMRVCVCRWNGVVSLPDNLASLFYYLN